MRVTTTERIENENDDDDDKKSWLIHKLIRIYRHAIGASEQSHMVKSNKHTVLYIYIQINHHIMYQVCWCDDDVYPFMDREFLFCERIKDFFYMMLHFQLHPPSNLILHPHCFHISSCVCVCVCRLPNKFAETDIYIYI